MPNLRSSLCTFPTALQETPNPVRLPLEHILLKGQFPTILISALQQLPSRRLSFSIVTETKKKLAYPKKQPSDLLETHKVFSRGGHGEDSKEHKTRLLTATHAHIHQFPQAAALPWPCRRRKRNYRAGWVEAGPLIF